MPGWPVREDRGAVIEGDELAILLGLLVLALLL
jgi:hypothetical protein